MKTQEKRHGGFTLLELLMVVIIIAILASIALPQYIKASEKARGAEALSILGAVRSAELRYRAFHPNNNYTDVVTDLDIDLGGGAEWGAPAFAVVAAAAGAPAKGESSVGRSAGQYSGQTVGITFGTGTICGTFTPLLPMPACGAPD